MDQLFSRFLNKLGITNLDLYSNCSFEVTKNDKENHLVYVTLHVSGILSYAAAKELLDKSDASPFKVSISFDYKNCTSQMVLKLLTEEFVASTGAEAEKMPECHVDKTNLLFVFYGKVHLDTFQPVMDMWEELLDELDLNYDIRADVKYTGVDVIAQRQKAIDDDMKKKIETKYFERMSKIYSPETQHNRVKGYYEPMKIHDIGPDSGNVIIDGKVFFEEEKVSRNKGTLIVSLYVYDHTDSITVMIFENRRQFAIEKLKEYKKVGNHLTIKGHAQVSKFDGTLQIVADECSINEEPFDISREDTAEVKRVELHAHTKMSTMDGVCTVDDYFKQAAKWGMKAFAITDHENCQIFPDAQTAGKKSGVKPLYGVEMNMIDDELEYIYNPSERELHNAEYVCFDFETTGLSARYDRIIEFGAVKFKDGLVVDSMDLMVDPEIPLPKFIISKTHITDAMVHGQTKIKPALEIMKRFIGDAILVSHNASFDVGFLNEALKNNGMEAITNPVIDTLSLSRYFFPDSKSHALGTICRQFQVDYDEMTAHRADYDATVLNDVWLAMMSLLTKDNFHIKHKDLAALHDDRMLKTLRPSHVTVYAKNAQGLKDLFVLVSLSCVKYFAGGTRIPRREIEKYRKNLIIGSACFNGEIFQTALTRGEKVLVERMKFYDFIEIQPPANYSYLVNMGQIRDNEQLLRMLKDIYDAAQKAGKPVVATGDCHYLSKEDKIFRDVYITAKAVGGGRHPLNPHSRDKMGFFENPDQEFRTTNEMLDCFAFMGEDIAKEIVVTNSNMIADQMEEIYPTKDRLYPPFIENCEEKLQELCYKTAKEHYGDPLPKIVADRLQAELAGILKYGYSVQYYIAYEIINQANLDGFIVGSRGSVGSSFVAFASKVTEVNALQPHYRCPKCKYSHWDVDTAKYRSGFDLPDMNCPKCGTPMIKDGHNIPFATFLGFHAEKVPDIDLNFSSDYQAKAHNLTKVFLGEDNVYRAGTIETVAEKTAYGFALGYYESLGIDTSTINKAEITRLAIGCQDVKRTTGQHPGGIIVIPADMSVYDFTPIQYPADDVNAAWKTTHFDFHKIHDNVLKLDLLGHVDPTVLKILNDMTGIRPQDIPNDDHEVFSLFYTDKALKRHANFLGETTGALGLPEFGTALSRKMLIETKPHCFADLLIISGLSHGTDVWQGNAEDLINSGTCTLQEVIGCRDDIMNYLISMGVENSTSFKVMEMVRKGKGLTPEIEDMLREHQVPEYFITSFKKIKYLFPKAHAVAYVMMACRVAWFKVHMPLEYYAVYFTTRVDQFEIVTMSKGEKAIQKRLIELSEQQKTGKLSPKETEIFKCLQIALEMWERGYEIGMIDINKSIARYWVVDHENNKIIPPFNVMDGLGISAAETVKEAREKRPFSSIEDLAARTKLSNQHIETLKKYGVLKDLPESDQLSLFDF